MLTALEFVRSCSVAVVDRGVQNRLCKMLRTPASIRQEAVAGRQPLTSPVTGWDATAASAFFLTIRNLPRNSGVRPTCGVPVCALDPTLAGATHTKPRDDNALGAPLNCAVDGTPAAQLGSRERQRISRSTGWRDQPCRRGGGEAGPREFRSRPVGHRQRSDPAHALTPRTLPRDHFRLGAGTAGDVRLRRDEADGGRAGGRWAATSSPAAARG